MGNFSNASRIFNNITLLPNDRLFQNKRKHNRTSSLFILSLLFSVTILFTLGNNSIHINDNLWFSKLGVYTYALYLYHTIIILLLIQVFKSLSFSNWYLLAITSLSITIGISIISYHLFEKQFLKLKRYFY